MTHGDSSVRSAGGTGLPAIDGMLPAISLLTVRLREPEASCFNPHRLSSIDDRYFGRAIPEADTSMRPPPGYQHMRKDATICAGFPCANLVSTIRRKGEGRKEHHA
jgi:hypothetical protein